MSGGSYEYLCFAESLGDLAGRREELERMHERLAALPWATVAADETARVISMLARAESHIRALAPLREVWRAIEWWDSGDWGEAQAREECASFASLGELSQVST